MAPKITRPSPEGKIKLPAEPPEDILMDTLKGALYLSLTEVTASSEAQVDVSSPLWAEILPFCLMAIGLFARRSKNL